MLLVCLPCQQRLVPSRFLRTGASIIAVILDQLKSHDSAPMSSHSVVHMTLHVLDLSSSSQLNADFYHCAVIFVQ